MKIILIIAISSISGALFGVAATCFIVAAKDRKRSWDRAWNRFTSGEESTGHPLMDCPDCGKWRGLGHVCQKARQEDQ